MIELRDGYAREYGFSWGDIISNLTGDALALLFELSPTLDDMFDFRLEYWPSAPFRKSVSTQGPFNSSEDYAGQRFVLGYHLSSIDALRESQHLGWTEYIDVALGFHAAHFKPDDTDSEAHSQELFVGLSVDSGASSRRPSCRRAPTPSLRPACVRCTSLAGSTRLPSRR